MSRLAQSVHHRLAWGGMLLAVLLLSGCQMPGMVPPGHPLPPAAPTASPTPLAPLFLPLDEGPHQDLTEWWYYTGHLTGRDPTGQTHQYGFEVTFFQSIRGNLPPAYIGHYAITDLTRQQYHTNSHIQLTPAAPASSGKVTSGFKLAIDDWTMSGLSGHDHVHATMPDYTLTLALDTKKVVPTLHNTDGILPLGALGSTYYYSRTRMAATGSLVDHGSTLPVTGTAWMDHQWGNFLPSLASWDWFSIQLNNDVEYMIFFLTDKNTSPDQIDIATQINPDGSTVALAPTAEVALGNWTSPTTHITYTSGWQLAVPGAQFTITPDQVNQEFVSQDGYTQPYWEGASTVKAVIGDNVHTGQAYVELTGRGK